MDKFLGQKTIAPALFPPIDPFHSEMLDTGDGHQVYVEQCGNRHGRPVVVLHGGPGAGAARRCGDILIPNAIISFYSINAAVAGRGPHPACKTIHPPIWWPTLK